jgi:hypothetical protein
MNAPDYNPEEEASFARRERDGLADECLEYSRRMLGIHRTRGRGMQQTRVVEYRTRMRVIPWKSGASAPRKVPNMNSGFSPRGTCHSQVLQSAA